MYIICICVIYLANHGFDFNGVFDIPGICDSDKYHKEEYDPEYKKKKNERNNQQKKPPAFHQEQGDEKQCMYSCILINDKKKTE